MLKHEIFQFQQNKPKIIKLKRETNETVHNKPTGYLSQMAILT